MQAHKEDSSARVDRRGTAVGLLNMGKRLDNSVLGASDSTRGFVFNAMSGLHPALAPVWLVAALILVVAGVAALASEAPGKGAVALIAASGCAVMGYVSRGLPSGPRS